MEWKASRHAIENAVERFHVEDSEAIVWMNNLMEDAFIVESQKDGRVLYQHRKQPVAFVAAPETKTIITVMYRPAEKVRIQTVFLDKICRGLTRALDSMETDFRHQLQEIVDSYAESMDAAGSALADGDTESYREALRDASMIDDRIQRLHAEYRASRLKVEAFIATSSSEEEETK